MIEAQDSLVILVWNSDWKVIFLTDSRELFQVYGTLTEMKGETAEEFFSAIGERFWADGDYAADCHGCGALSKVWIL